MVAVVIGCCRHRAPSWLSQPLNRLWRWWLFSVHPCSAYSIASEADPDDKIDHFIASDTYEDPGDPGEGVTFHDFANGTLDISVHHDNARHLGDHSDGVGCDPAPGTYLLFCSADGQAAAIRSVPHVLVSGKGDWASPVKQYSISDYAPHADSDSNASPTMAELADVPAFDDPSAVSDDAINEAQTHTKQASMKLTGRRRPKKNRKYKVAFSTGCSPARTPAGSMCLSSCQTMARPPG